MQPQEPQATVPNILIVDDSPANLRLLTSMLRDRGYKPRPVTSGELALEAARLSPPDLILLDITMPEMDGFEVCERLKADPQLCTIPILFISALTDATVKVKAFTAGGSDYITKPFQFEEVEARVRMQLELQRQKHALEKSYEQLRKLEDLRDSLTHMVVHDMRGQLMAMMLSLEMIPDFGDESDMHLERARQGAAGLVDMMATMLDISRLEAEEMPLSKQECELASISRAVIDSLSPTAGTRNVSLRAEERISATCDPELVRRILQNILANALKFTPTNGTVDINLSLDNGTARVAISDNGPGIAPSDRTRVFEKFQQAEDCKSGIGTGLGLAFSKLAVEAHGGQIGVESEVGQGTTFWFTLPGGSSASASRMIQ